MKFSSATCHRVVAESESFTRRSRRRQEAEGVESPSGYSASSPRRLPGKSAVGPAGAFTLVEVLAALAFMAIVIPVTIEAFRVASLAGQVGQYKAVASRIADRTLNELIVTGQYRNSTQRGTVHEGVLDYQWTMRSETWPLSVMRLVTVQVTFPVQGRDYDVRLSTLAPNSTQ